MPHAGEENRLSESLENYIEVIYRIIRTKGVARVKEIASSLSVRMPSVNSALKSLQKLGLVEHSRYGYVELTEKGVAAAEEVLCRHETLCEFLESFLGVSRDIAESDACKMEHVISRDTFGRILALVEYLQTCAPADREWVERFHSYVESGPHKFDWPEGAPLSQAGCAALRKRLVPLSEVAPGRRAMVHRLTGSGSVHQRMLEMGVVPGTPILVERVAPLGDPMEIKVRGYHLSLRREEAAKIKVIPIEEGEGRRGCR